MQHEYLMAEKICENLYKQGYTSIRYERVENNDFQTMVMLRACLLHAWSNIKLKQEHPLLHNKIKRYIDSINLSYFIKNPKDRKKYGL